MRDRAGLAIVGAALLLRVIHVLTIRDYPLFDVLGLDSDAYDTWAREIVAGRFVRDAPFYQAPLYAYFLAVLHAISGGDLLLPRLVNAVLGAVQVALVIHLGKRLFGRATGLLAGAITAVYAPFLFEEGKVMKTALGLVLSTGTLALLIESRMPERRLRWLFAAGVSAGLAALVRENFALVAAAFAGALALRGWREPERFYAPACFAAGFLLAILPATLHNFAASRELIPLTSQAGQNFYIGNFAGNPHGGYLVPDFVRRNPRFEEIDFAAEAERRTGRALSPAQTSRFWFGEAWRDLSRDPLRFPRGILTKLGLLFNDFEIPDDEDLRFFRRYAPVLGLPLPGFATVGILGLVGFAVHLRRRTLSWELGLFVVAYSLSVALFFVFARYRLPLVAPLAILAADRTIALARAARAHRLGPVAAHGAAAAAIGLVVLRPIDEGTTFANSYLSVGIALEVKGRKDEALAELQKGLVLEPGNAKLLKHAARIEAERDPTAPATVDLLRRALAADPTSDEIAFRLAGALASSGERTEAVRLFEEIRARGGEPPGLHANLAILYLELGRDEEAVQSATQALAQDPNDVEMSRLVERIRSPRAGSPRGTGS